MNSIDRYMARLIAVPLMACLAIALMLLILDRIRLLFEIVATEGGPVSVVWRMLANLLPEYLGQGVPIGLLLGVLLAFRRLAISSELDVLRAVGISYARLLRVPYMFALGMALLNFAIVGFLQPQARYAYEGLRYEIRTGELGASIKIGEFVLLPGSQQVTLRIEDSQNEGRDLSGIFVHSASKTNEWYSLTAQHGTFLRTDNPDEIIFHLTNGTMLQKTKDSPIPRVLTFSSHNLPIELPKLESFRERGGHGVELTLPELVRLGSDPTAKPDIRVSSQAAFYYRMVEVVSIFLLPLLAVALAIPPKRSTSALGVLLSVVIIVTFHKVNEYGQAIGSLGKIDPIIALGTPFVIFAGLVFWMYHIVAHVPGGQPIGALERVFAKIVATIVRHIPGRTRREVLAS